MKPGQRYYRCGTSSNPAAALAYTSGFTCPNNVSDLNSNSLTTTYHCRTKRTEFLHRPKYIPNCIGFFDKNKQLNNTTVDRNSNNSYKYRTAQKLKLGTRFR